MFGIFEHTSPFGVRQLTCILRVRGGWRADPAAGSLKQRKGDAVTWLFTEVLKFWASGTSTF